VSNTIRLSTVEHEELTRASRQYGRGDEARRARLILLLGAGYTWASIRAKLDCADSFIARWSKRFGRNAWQGCLAATPGSCRLSSHRRWRRAFWSAA